MKFRSSFVVLLGVSVLSLGLMTGCGDDKPEGGESPEGTETGAVDPHDVPITDEQKAEMKEQAATLADAVAMLKGYRDVVEAETKDGIPTNPFKAHQALDKADILTEWLPQIAQDSGLAMDQQMKVTPAANALREAFDAVHLNIDAEKDPDFASVGDVIESNLTALEAIATADSSEVSGPPLEITPPLTTDGTP